VRPERPDLTQPVDGERAMPNSPNTTNLFHDDRSYLPVGLVAAASSGSISSVVLMLAARLSGLL
jgi:hypothetical protein